MVCYLAAISSRADLCVVDLQAMSSGGRMTQIPLTVNAMCPSHGPVVQASLTELLRSYQYDLEPPLHSALCHMPADACSASCLHFSFKLQCTQRGV